MSTWICYNCNDGPCQYKAGFLDPAPVACPPQFTEEEAKWTKLEESAPSASTNNAMDAISLHDMVSAKKGANMLFEIFYDQVPTSLVLDKIIGVCPHQSGMVKSKVFLSGDPDGFNSSEEYSVLSARLYAALEAAEARKLRITAVA